MTLSRVEPRNVITTDDGRQYKKPGLGKQYLGYAAGSVVADGMAIGLNAAAGLPFFKMIKKIPQNPIYSEAADRVLITSGLADKGVKIIDAVDASRPIVDNIMNNSLKSLDKYPMLKNIIKKINEITVVGPAFMGCNAFFEPKSNSIVVSKEKMGYATFHEMGHAINKNMSKYGKALQKMRTPFLLAGSLVSLIALSKRAKADGEEPKGIYDKVTSFIKSNAGKLTFLGFVPMLMEEGLASFNAAKMAKSVLDVKAFKTMSKFNKIAWLTYFALAAGAGLGTMLGVKIKDKIAKPQEIKHRSAMEKSLD